MLRFNLLLAVLAGVLVLGSASMASAATIGHIETPHGSTKITLDDGGTADVHVSIFGFSWSGVFPTIQDGDSHVVKLSRRWSLDIVGESMGLAYRGRIIKKIPVYANYTVTPEPSAALLFGVGVAVAAGAAGRRR